MKRFAFRLTIAVLTFTVGIASVWLLVRRWSRHRAQKAVEVVQITNAATLPLAILKPVGELPESLSPDYGASIQFFDDEHGFVSMNGKLWRTTDGGFMWRMVFSVQPRSDAYSPWLGPFQFIDAQRGWLLSNETLYKTDDGGLSWRIVKQPIEYSAADGLPVGPNDFALLPDGRHAWIIGTKYRKLNANEDSYHTRYSTSDSKKVIAPLVYYTANGGRSWSYQPLPGKAYDLWTIEAYDRDHAWAAGIAGTFCFQSGKWRESNPTDSGNENYAGDECLAAYIGAPTNAPDSFFFTDANNGWITNTNGFVGHTTDGGRHWQDEPGDSLIGSGNSGGFWQTTCGITIRFFDKIHGYGIDGDGFLRRTSDGGLTWEMFDRSQVFTDLFALDPEHVWVVSKEGIFKIAEANRSK